MHSDNRKEQFKAAREINKQLNFTESRNNLPVVNSRPLRIGFDISDACNVRCIFCLAENGRKPKSHPEAFRKPELLDPFEPILPFINLAILSSYEAVLNPWLDRFVEKFWEYRTPLQIFSNGNAFEPELSEYLLQRGLKSLWCSFHAADKNTYETIMKGSDYDKVLNNLMYMKHYAKDKGLNDYKLTMVFCAMRRNIKELPGYVELAHKLGAQEIQVNYLLVTREGLGLEEEAMCFHPELYDYMVCKAKLRAAQLGITLKHQRLFSEGAKEADTGPCYRPWEHMIVNKCGETTVCCGGCGSVGNMFEQGFPQMWNSRRLIDFRSRVNSDNPPAACRKCTRGRENPWDVSSHITYLRNKGSDEKSAKIKDLIEKNTNIDQTKFINTLKENTLEDSGRGICVA